jgi:hypothetical protein
LARAKALKVRKFSAFGLIWTLHRQGWFFENCIVWELQ